MSVDSDTSRAPTADAIELWMIVAIIQPFKLDVVTLALEAIPEFVGVTVSDCRGFGHGKVRGEPTDSDRVALSEREQSQRPAIWRDPSEQPGSVVDFTPKVKLEIVVTTRVIANRVVDVITRAAHTGRRGDGKIFVLRVDRVVRVRTFEEGANAV